MATTKGKKKRRKIYTLYGAPGAPISSQTRDYDGELMNIAAVSVKQAYYYAGNSVWAEGPENPAGIVEYYRRGWGPPGDHRFWCGCRIFEGAGFGHGMSETKLRAAMEKHLENCPN